MVKVIGGTLGGPIMWRSASLLSAITAAALFCVSLQALERRPTPANWPDSPYPAGKPAPGGGMGCRLPLKELIQQYKKPDLVIKTNLEDADGHWGTYTVGDEVKFGAAIGPPDTRVFGSVKHGSDGGDLFVTCYWMDEDGRKVLAKSNKTVTAGC